MTLVDANLLPYARDSGSRHHEAAREWLAALAIEHGSIYSADTDFAGFEAVRWVNPLD